ncbi:12175_t:CDS:2, partial [Entrophospora sp. SA101]
MEKEVEITTTTQESSSSQQDQDQQSDNDLIVLDSYHCTSSMKWTKRDKTILLKHCLGKRISTKELYRLGLLKKNQAMSKQWRSMKREIKKLFD